MKTEKKKQERKILLLKVTCHLELKLAVIGKHGAITPPAACILHAVATFDIIMPQVNKT